MKTKELPSFIPTALLVLLTWGTLAACDQKPAAGEAEGSYSTLRNPGQTLGIVREREPADYRWIFQGKTDFPRFDPQSDRMWQVDVRSADLSGFDLSGRYSDLVHADFDSQTRWPARLPQGFDPAAVMEQAKDPGLGVRTLHRQGITGKGVGIAIIDQGLLTGHREYRDRLRFYEEIHCADETSMHGAAVASLAVGETVGVAPGADLYFIAQTHGTFRPDGFDTDLSYLAQAIDRIVEVNRTLPEGGKIRAISISLGLGGDQKNGQLVQEAIRRAGDQKIFVISVDTAGLGSGREFLSDPNDFNGVRPGAFWRWQFEARPDSEVFQRNVKYPMDRRCTASPTGVSDYVYYSDGGMSWAVPYMAGLYVLCCQVDPAMTPARFQALARETSVTVGYQDGGKPWSLPRVIDPVRLIERVRSS